MKDQKQLLQSTNKNLLAGHWSKRIIAPMLLFNTILTISIVAIPIYMVISGFCSNFSCCDTSCRWNYFEKDLLEVEITKLRETYRTCSVELNDLKEDISPCLVTDTPITATMDPNASTSRPIDIYNWVEAPNGLEYWISGDVDFFEANTTCISKGGQLALSGVRESSTRKFLADNFIGPRGVSVWIGLTDLEEEGVWFWQDGVLATAFNTDWGYAKPDNSGTNSDCAIIYSDQLMYDEPCHYWFYRALCEREPDGDEI